MSTVIIKTNNSQATDVLIRDLGFSVPSSGGSVSFNEFLDFLKIAQSRDLRSFLTDDAFGANSSTLILNDGTNDISQVSVDSFLNTLATPFTPLDLVIGGSLNSAGSLPIINLASTILSINRTFTNMRGRRGIPGASGTTTIQAEINGSPITNATLSWDSTDAAFTLKTSEFTQTVIPGDRVSLRITARELGNPQDIFVELD